MNAPIPSEIDIDQFRLALTTFCDSLGINPMSAYFPMVITDSEVVFPCHPSRASEGRPKAIQVPADEHPQGILHGEMSTMVRIKVVR